MVENEELVEKLIECPLYEGEEPANACGRFTNSNGTQYDCAHEELMKKHGVASGSGCAENLVDDETGEIVDVEICYCSSNGCNRNCTCSETHNNHGSSEIYKINSSTASILDSKTISETNADANGTTGLETKNSSKAELNGVTLGDINETTTRDPIKKEKKGKKAKGKKNSK